MHLEDRALVNRDDHPQNHAFLFHRTPMPRMSP